MGHTLPCYTYTGPKIDSLIGSTVAHHRNWNSREATVPAANTRADVRLRREGREGAGPRMMVREGVTE